MRAGEEEVEAEYHGETSTTCYTRQKEHLSGWERRRDNNPLWKHHQLHHPDTPPEFEFKPEKFFNDPLSKSMFEGVSINRSPSTEGYLMNSKAEFRQGEVARVVVERGLRE